MERKTNADRKNLQLYAITDSHWLNGRTLYSVVKESLEGGVTFLQLREKELDEEHFLEEARELQKLCREYQVPFVINDNVDIAAAINADGVHVGQSDMEAGDVRAKLGPDKDYRGYSQDSRAGSSCPGARRRLPGSRSCISHRFQGGCQGNIF